MDANALDTIPRSALPALLERCPKAELHIHIEGSLEPELIFRLAQRNGCRLAYPDVEALRRAYAFTDLQSFLDIYYAGASVLLKEQDFFDMAFAYLERAATDNVVHAEVFFDPQTHTDRGVPFGTVIVGLEHATRRAKAEFGISASLILCFPRYWTYQWENCANIAVQEGTVYVYNPQFPDKVVEVPAGKMTKACEGSPPFQPIDTSSAPDLIILGTPPDPGKTGQPPITDTYPGILQPQRPRQRPSYE